MRGLLLIAEDGHRMSDDWHQAGERKRGGRLALILPLSRPYEKRRALALVERPPNIATQVCYTHGMQSVTSSFRMSKELQRQLSDVAERTGKGKNAIIIEALATYLRATERQSLAEEARRQSELVSRNEHDAGWYGLADTSGWR